MPTSSTIPAAKAKLTSLLTDAFAGDSAVSVSYAWNPEAKGERVYLGRPPEEASTGTSNVPVMKAGRKPRQESYGIEVTIQVWKPGETPATANAVETRAFDHLALVDGVVADDPNLGLDPNFIAQAGDFAWQLRPFEKGWACEIALLITCSARLS